MRRWIHITSLHFTSAETTGRSFRSAITEKERFYVHIIDLIGINNSSGQIEDHLRTLYYLTMAFMVKHVVGGQLKNLTGGLTEEKSEGDKSDAAAKGMTQEEFEEYQQQLEEEK